MDWVNPLVHTTSNPKYVNAPSGKNTIFEYDENFRQTYQVAALGTDDAAESRFQYDEVGNLTWARDPRLSITTFGYDARNRRIWMDDPIAADRNTSGHTMNWEYDSAGNKTKETRADNAFRSWDYDSLNRLSHAIDWRMNTSETPVTTTYIRDLPNGQNVTIEHVIDAKGAEYKLEFDALRRKTSETYPMDATQPQVARTETFTYDIAGNLARYKNPADQYKHFDYADSYDSRNRLRHAAWNLSPTDHITVDRNVGQEITTDYDAASRLTQLITNNGETTVGFGYDEANRQIWEDQTLNGYPPRHIETLRDVDGNRRDLYLPGYYLFYYDYTQRNQLAHIRDGNNNPVWTYTYDANGNVTNRLGEWFYPNGVNHTYDDMKRTTLIEQGDSSIVFSRSHYQYDNVGREVATWRNGPQDEPGAKGERFWYNTNNQMTTAWYKADNVSTSPSNPTTWREYTFSPDKLNWSSVNDNGYNVPFAANALNQYTSVNGSTPQYDERFNLHVFGGSQYDYDSANHLTGVTGNGHSASFTYDGLGRCVRRTIDTETRLFAYDGWKPICEWDEAGRWKAVNIYGPGSDEILGRYDAVLGALIYKQDKHGNVMFLLDESSQIVEKYTYDAYGRPTILSPTNTQLLTSAVGNRFMFQGREYLSELGISDFRNRMYNPSIGRFLQSDPLGFGGGDRNFFRYCSNDPVNGSDPLGLTGVFYYYQSGNNVQFYVPVTYSGPGSYLGPGLALTASRQWTVQAGQYNTTMTLYTPSGSSATNAVNITYGLNRSENNVDSVINLYIPGEWGQDAGEVLAHELAHIMGLNHLQRPLKDDGIMLDVAAPPTEDQIHKIVAGNRNTPADLKSPLHFSGGGVNPNGGIGNSIIGLLGATTPEGNPLFGSFFGFGFIVDLTQAGADNYQRNHPRAQH